MPETGKTNENWDDYGWGSNDLPTEPEEWQEKGKLKEIYQYVDIDYYPKWKIELEQDEEVLKKTQRVFDAAKHYDEARDYSKFFNDLLEIANNDFAGEKDPKIKVNMRDFIDLADKFSEKGVPPQFLMGRRKHKNFDEIFKEADLSQEGVRIFTTTAAKKEFTDFTFGEWLMINDEKKTENVIKISKDLFDLASKDANVKEGEELKKMISLQLESSIEYWADQRAWQPIFDIRDKISQVPEMIAEVDGGKMIDEDQLIGYVREFGQHGEVLFPKTFDHIRERIFNKLDTDLDIADYLVENIAFYPNEPWVGKFVMKAIESHYSVAKKFVDIVAHSSPDDGWPKEEWVKKAYDYAYEMVSEKEISESDNHDFNPYGYGGLEDEGFRESDPFEKHQWRITSEQIKRASAYKKVFAGKYDLEKDSAEFKNLGIDLKESEPWLSEISKLISIKFIEFRAKIESNRKINLDDRETIAGHWSSSGISITPLLDNVQEFVGRYIAQTLSESVSNFSMTAMVNEMPSILEKGFGKYEKVLEVDVPLYDKLYKEFDELRDNGRKPLEVYLGRDGIYAWLGRRAQDLARRRKMTVTERKNKKEKGEIFEINPKYVVYPRYFRDNLAPDVKKQFLEQESISPETDPLFYDTGYTGTIPEQIMEIMGFDKEDIEKRIKLLSAPYAHRRVKGIPENARSEVIEYIEHNAKIEQAAEGLIIDERTGKIKHIAEPTNPEEQFYFSMIRQAIVRHYWLQEKSHHSEKK